MTPDYEAVHVDRYNMGGEYTEYMIPPTGFLAAVGVMLLDYGSSPEPMDFEITGPDHVALFGKFTVHTELGFHKGGVMFPEPIPNMNVAVPYILVAPSGHPRLEITTVGMWQQR
jgi:hypothetical protein